MMAEAVFGQRTYPKKKHRFDPDTDPWDMYYLAVFSILASIGFPVLMELLMGARLIP